MSSAGRSSGAGSGRGGGRGRGGGAGGSSKKESILELAKASVTHCVVVVRMIIVKCEFCHCKCIVNAHQSFRFFHLASRLR
jgi:hypothetical protein